VAVTGQLWRPTESCPNVPRGTVLCVTRSVQDESRGSQNRLHGTHKSTRTKTENGSYKGTGYGRIEGFLTPVSTTILTHPLRTSRSSSNRDMSPTRLLFLCNGRLTAGTKSRTDTGRVEDPPLPPTPQTEDNWPDAVSVWLTVDRNDHARGCTE